jgi:hypothetical protein
MECLRQERIVHLELLEDKPDVILDGRSQQNLQLNCRGSRFLGVSKNGKKWQVSAVHMFVKLYVQVMIVKGHLKKYLGSMETQQLAARFYDKYSIILWGLYARTNYTYNRHQALELLKINDANKSEFLYQNPHYASFCYAARSQQLAMPLQVTPEFYGRG